MGNKKLAFINKDMLVWARKETPFDRYPEQVSEHFPKISSEKLKKWESGEELPSIREAKEMAKIYKLPFASFYLTDIPSKKPRNYTDRRTINGTKYNEISYELWNEISRVCSERDILLEFTNEERYPFLLLPTVTATDNVESVAEKIRDFFELPKYFLYKKEYKNNSFNYFRNILERHGIIVSQISSVSLSEMKGLSIYDDKYPIIAINNKDFEKSKTFSLFHELAHLIRRSSSLCLIDDNERNDNEEKICDCIAAEVLMEHSTFKKIAMDIYTKEREWNDKTLMDLANKFGVSAVAAFRRLYDLSIISDSQYYDMYKEINNSFEEYLKNINSLKNKKVPIYFHVRYINYHGNLLPRMIITAQNSGKITVGEACKIMNIKSQYYDDIARAVMK